MKKIFAILLFSVITFSVNAQARLGWTEWEIRNDFPSYTFTSGTTDYGTNYISTTFERTDVVYYFNENNLCYFVLIVPKTQGDLNFYAQLYNSKYVIVSDTEWKAYLKNGSVMHIELTYESENDVTFFYIH